MSFDFAVPKNFQLEELIEINTKLDGIVENIESIRKLNDEQSILLMLILAVHATNAGLVKPYENLATDIKNTLASRRIGVEVEGSKVYEPSKDM
jgi:hypothetical protein